MKTSELLDAIGDAARQEAEVADEKMSRAVLHGEAFTGGTMWCATSQTMLAVMRIMRAAAERERAAEAGLAKREESAP
jgi:hypothetical protein